MGTQMSYLFMSVVFLSLSAFLTGWIGLLFAFFSAVCFFRIGASVGAMRTDMAWNEILDENGWEAVVSEDGSDDRVWIRQKWGDHWYENRRD